MTDTTRGAFPEGFVWGSATSSYQIEGAVAEDGRSESIWDRFCRTPGKVANGDTGDVACDHYHRYRDDVDLMRRLNLDAYRFSIAWPRVVPDGRGAVNQAGLDFYDRLVDTLLEAGITPWATLYHWDLPQVLQDAGGWPERATADAFTEYADAVTRRLGDRVTRWITLNEPWVSAILGYLVGIHAPGHQDMGEALAAAHTLLLAHGRAVPVVRANSPGAEVGITLNLIPAYPIDPESEADHAAVRAWDGQVNRWFLDPIFGRGYPEDIVARSPDAMPAIEPGDLDAIAVPTDFMGVNYYSPAYQSANEQPGMPEPGSTIVVGGREIETTAMGWPVVPEALTDLLLRVTREYPVSALYITENGAAYDDPEPSEGRVADPKRQGYYEGHLAATLDAIGQGAPVRGYFAWSLMDNFEWAEGYTKRFGITHVDYATQARTIKDSGHRYAEIAANNALG